MQTADNEQFEDIQLRRLIGLLAWSVSQSRLNAESRVNSILQLYNLLEEFTLVTWLTENKDNILYDGRLLQDEWMGPYGNVDRLLSSFTLSFLLRYRDLFKQIPKCSREEIDDYDLVFNKNSGLIVKVYSSNN